MRFSYLLFVFLFSAQSLFAQVSLRGVVKDNSGQTLPGATVMVRETNQGTVSASNGSFELRLSQPGDYHLEVRFVGYETKTTRVNVGTQPGTLEIILTPSSGLMPEVVVTGTRTSRELYEVPLRLDVVDKARVEATPALSADDYLKSLPGLNVSRGASFLSSANVSMRGMSNEQGRILVMQDGVPLNKTDGGSVNWNAIDALDIEKIEVLKGPGSSIHGGNAMGGVINFISGIPTQPLQGAIRQSIGTFGTSRTNLNFSGRSGKMFWRTSGFYRQSDGYITAPQDEIDEFTIASFLDEYCASGRMGYLFSDNHLLEGGLAFYNGKRGTGSQYEGFEMAAPEGSFNNYEALNGSINYTGKFSEAMSLNLTAYGQRENYQNIRESVRSAQLTRYDVESIRTDLGLFSSLNLNLASVHSLLGGLDIRHGAVDGADIYLTSSDQVLNLGKMNQFGLFIQDEYNPGQGPWRILAGLRYDFASFYDGAFRVLDPTSETAFLQNFDGDLEDASWGAISPRLSVQYYNEGAYRVFAGYSRGFRAPVLDDMCRTGRISGGMKIANPYLEPEYVDNIELGSDLFPVKGLTVSPTIYYATGSDYHAYISTGDSLLMNNRMRPIRKKDNIGKVEIFGTELAANYQISRSLALHAAWAFTDTEILEYKVLDPNEDLALEGNELVYQPRNLFNAGLNWQNKWFSLYATYNYKDAQWLNDANTELIESYSSVDLQIQSKIYRGFSAAVMVHNLFDTDFVDSRNVIAPGRMITAEIRFVF